MAKDSLTPEQLACIRQATEALEKLRDLMPVEEDHAQEEMPDTPTPEYIYNLLTCGNQRPMTLQLFKCALRHLELDPLMRNNTNRRCLRCQGLIYNQMDAVCEYCIAKIVG